jgi:3D (Asp-Asp-Asp) domain-containing protein
MKTISIFFIISCLCSCSAIEKEQTQKPSALQKIKARITYYYPQAPFGKKVSDQNTKVAKKGITVAAHPDFKFGTKIIIPNLKGKVGNGTFIVQDRGSAVTKKKASKGKGYVFDVFVDNRKDMNILQHKSPEWMEVFVVKN